MFEALKNSSIVWAILSFCTLASLIFAIYSWHKGNRNKELSVERTKYQIIRKGKSLIDNLDISFNKKAIDDLTISKFAIWNSGNDVIRHEDLALDGPLIIKSMGNAEIFNAEIVSEKINHFSTEHINSKTVRFDFEYVDKQEGVVVQVLHSGDASDLHVECTIKGGKKVRDANSRAKEKSPSKIKINPKTVSAIAMGFEIIFSIVILIILILDECNIIPEDSIFHLNRPETVESYSLLPLIILFGIMVLIMITSYFYAIRQRFHLNVPSKLRQYIDIEVQ